MNHIFFSPCSKMEEISERSTSLVIGSPPYSRPDSNESIEDSKNKFASLIYDVMEGSYRILKPGGTLVIITTDERQKGLLWSKSSLMVNIANSLGFHFFDDIIWKKAERNLFRIPYAHILIFGKKGKRTTYHLKGLDNIFARKIWDLPDSQVRRSRRGDKFTSAIHPGVVSRAILRFTKKNDLVVNPFVGSGTILGVANLLQRKWIGYETRYDLKPMIEETMLDKNSPLYKRIDLSLTLS